MLKLKYRTSLLMTSGLLLLTPFAHAADDDSEGWQLEYILKLSEQTAQDDQWIQVALALSSGEKEPVEQEGTKHEAAVREDDRRRQKEAQVLLAKYIGHSPYEIPSNARHFVDFIGEFIARPSDFSGMGDRWNANLINEDVLELKSNRQEKQSWFKEFCETENLSYVIALPLFSGFWDRIEQNESIKSFQEVSRQLKGVVETNAPKITALLQNGNFSRDAEHFKKEMKNFGIVALFHKINGIKEEILRFFDSLAQETPDQFLARSPIINWGLLLNQQEVARLATEKAEEEKSKIFT